MVSLRVLLVDDDDGVRSILVDFLTRGGHRVTAAANARDARDAMLAPDADYDLLVLDWSLPDLSGRELLRAAQLAIPSCPVLVTTGLGEDAVSERIAEHGVAGILRKPFSLRAFSRAVDAALARQESDRIVAAE